MDDLEERDLYAMFAMCGMLAREGYDLAIPLHAYKLADEMLLARKPLDKAGITAINKRR
jgi:hypothetical protein